MIQDEIELDGDDFFERVRTLCQRCLVLLEGEGLFGSKVRGPTPVEINKHLCNSETQTSLNRVRHYFLKG